MKKVTSKTSLFIFLVLLGFYSCKKSESVFNEVKTTAKAKTETETVVPKTNEKGMLNFSSKLEMENFVNFIKSQTYRSISDAYKKTGFKPLNATKNTSPEKISAIDYLSFILNEKGLVQINGKVIKPIFSEKDNFFKIDYFYIIDENNKSDLVKLNDLSNISNLKKYTSSDLNRDPEFESSGSGVPMFGYGSWSNSSCTLMPQNEWTDMNNNGTPDPTYRRCRTRDIFVFWIDVGNDEDCYPAWGCSG